MCLKKILKFRRKLIVFLLFLLIINLLKNRLWPCVNSMTDYDKCPACFGSSACTLLEENIKIKPFDFHTTMSHILPSKNVFFGELNNKKIVVKKLAQYEELSAFDEMICKEGLNCCVHRKYNNEYAHSIDYFSRVLDDVSSDFISDDTSGLIICPNPRSTHFFDKLRKSSRYFNDINLWTLVRLNPEPIILEILRAGEGWPVPRYYGACGRIVIEEYVGLSLPAYYHAPWLLRAKIALGLLKAVQMLTFRDPNFSYYLTDMSPDNIAVNEEYKPIFIDLEHVIVVQRNDFSNDKPEYFGELHESADTIECKNCFVFSPIDICSHRISDHNYYTVCKHILSPESSTETISGGFLHDVPKDISSGYPDLKIMLAECSVPSGSQTRIEMAEKLIELLEKMPSD